MNYGKRGIVTQARALSSGTDKWGKKAGVFGFYCLISAIFGSIIIGSFAVFGVFKGIIDSAPEFHGIADATPLGLATHVYDSKTGDEVAKLVQADSNRIPVGRNLIPDYMADAFVALEDERFYEHNGIDIHGIIRAAFKVVASRDLSQGASTITQQLIKNTKFPGFSNETKLQSVKRKVQEQYLAVQLEKTASKEDILTNYMNTINLGQGTLGVESAALRYFGRHASELNLSECAAIAGITQNPSKYNPISHPENNDEKRKIVLNKMLQQKKITQAEYDEAINDDVYSRIQTNNESLGPEEYNSYYIDALCVQVKNDLINEAGYTEQEAHNMLYSGGLQIFSAQDAEIQAICDEVYSNEENYPKNTRYKVNYALTVYHADGTDPTNYSIEQIVERLKEKKKNISDTFTSEEDAQAAIDEFKAMIEEEKNPNDKIEDTPLELVPQPQVSIVVEDQRTGYVVALVGGRGKKSGNRTFNRATDAKRQPGSTFKVLAAFAPGIDSGKLTLASAFYDAPFAYDDGRQVKNWYSGYKNDIFTVRKAIEQSMNVITVEAFTYIGVDLGFDYLKKFGFTTLYDGTDPKHPKYNDKNQATCLGGLTVGVTNLELNAAYATIANGGVRVKPTLYTKINDKDGNTIIDHSDPSLEGRSEQVLKPTTAYLLTDAMRDVVTKGTGKAVNFNTTPIAGKTGTTSKNVDVWFAGFTDYYTATTWAGNDDVNPKKPETYLNGNQTSLAKTLWKKVMQEIHKNRESRDFKAPDGITKQAVCSKSGLLPIPEVCGGTTFTELFAVDNVPTESCNNHVGSCEMCALENVPASPECPFKIHGAGVSYSAPPELEKGFKLAGTSVSVQVAGDDNNGQDAGPHCSHDANWIASTPWDIIMQMQQSIWNQLFPDQQQPEGGDQGDGQGGFPGGFPNPFGQQQDQQQPQPQPQDQGDNQNQGDNQDHGDDNHDDHDDDDD